MVKSAFTANLARTTKLAFTDKDYEKEYVSDGVVYKHSKKEPKYSIIGSLQQLKKIFKSQPYIRTLCWTPENQYEMTYFIENPGAMYNTKYKVLSMHVNHIGHRILPYLYHQVMIMFLAEYLIDKHDQSGEIIFARRITVHEVPFDKVTFVYKLDMDSDMRVEFLRENIHHYIAAVKWSEGELNEDLVKSKKAYKLIKKFFSLYIEDSITCDELMELVEHDYDMCINVDSETNEEWRRIVSMLSLNGEVEIKSNMKLKKCGDKLIIKDTSSNVLLTENPGENVLTDYHTYGLEVETSSLQTIVDDMNNPIEREQISNTQYDHTTMLLVKKQEKEEIFDMIKELKPHSRVSNYDLYFITLTMLKLHTLLLCIGCVDIEKAKHQFLMRSFSKFIHHRVVCSYVLENQVLVSKYMQSYPVNFLNNFELTNYTINELNRRYYLTWRVYKAENESKMISLKTHLLQEATRLGL